MSSLPVDEPTPAPSTARHWPRMRLGHRPGLDGVRGIAILAVVAAHTERFRSQAAFLGVDLFFVLSGFLITSLLLEEWERRKTISLRRFYMRRILRLLPALAVMLLTFMVYHWLTSPRPTARAVSTDALVAFFYCANWTLAYGFHQPNLLGTPGRSRLKNSFTSSGPCSCCYCCAELDFPSPR